MTSAAQQEPIVEPFALQATGTMGVSGALKQVVAERVAAHRSRRGAPALREPKLPAGRPEELATVRGRGLSRVRDAVAARYVQALSYREFLAEEADRALRQAEAEAPAEIPTLLRPEAESETKAQLPLLAELAQWNQPDSGPREQAMEEVRAQARGDLAQALVDIALGARELIGEAGFAHNANPHPGSAARPELAANFAGSPGMLTEISSGGLTVKLCEDLPVSLSRSTSGTSFTVGTGETARIDPGELQELEQELAFRQDPHFEASFALQTLETTPIPANLIEFPRQLIAPRKVRPRLAEGPLREEAPAEPQLRIFEVPPESVLTVPQTEAAAAPDWQSLLLEAAHPHVATLPANAPSQLALPLQVAPLGRRLMAFLVDSCCLAAALAAFAALALRLAGPMLGELPRPLIGAISGGVLLSFYTLYQFLFFTLSNATPGMRYARLALCTFGDDNPSRRAMRRRALATLLAASPLGLGLFWLFLDSERLGWHDRMSRMYQRAY